MKSIKLELMYYRESTGSRVRIEEWFDEDECYLTDDGQYRLNMTAYDELVQWSKDTDLSWHISGGFVFVADTAVKEVK